jgi:hypothetical protein
MAVDTEHACAVNSIPEKRQNAQLNHRQPEADGSAQPGD